MYLDHFQLTEHPFRLTPDADFLYLTPQHEAAYRCMIQAAARHDGIAVVTGDVGCGKTTLLNKVTGEFEKETTVARVTQSNLAVDEFLQSVLVRFGFEPFGRSKSELMTLLDNFLFAQQVRGHHVLLVVDEAQLLADEVLDEIKLMVDMETHGERLISAILVAQPELRERLDGARLRALTQRIHCHVHIDPLDAEDTPRYIAHRLGVAGYAGDALFTRETCIAIHQRCSGVPRLINNLCHASLAAACMGGLHRVTAQVLASAVEELSLPGVDDDVEHDDPQVVLTVAGRPAPPDAHSEGLAHLTVSFAGAPSDHYDIDGDRVLIGRDDDNDLVIKSQFVSRHHAQIMTDSDGRLWIKDLNSTNGVFLNGQRVKRGRFGNGDVVGIGRHRLALSGAPTASDSSNAQGHAEYTATERNGGGPSEPVVLEDWRETTVLQPDSTSKASNE